MIRSESITMIREKALEGKSAYAIGKELGISKNTAKKYMHPSEDMKKPKLKPPSKLDPFKEEIHKLMSMGFVPKVCRIKRPQTKGEVERLVHYVKNNFMPGRIFTDIHDLNHQAVIWCDKINSHISYSTGHKPIDLLPKEKLLPLPSNLLCNRYRYETRAVSRDGFVSYDGVRYGVPWQYSGKQVTVRRVKGTLEILDGLLLVASHEIDPRSGKILFIKGQYQGLSEKNGLTYNAGAYMKDDEVEIRPLSLYGKLLEVSNG